MSGKLHALIHTEVGVAALVGSDRAATGLIWPQRSADIALRRLAMSHPGSAAAGEGWFGHEIAGGLAEYFAGRAVEFTDVPVDLSGLPPFFAQVLTVLQGIGYGRTISYGDLARRAGRPGAARAVGQAMAANPLPIILPCHRVLRSDGGLGGFSADEGIALKRRLLAMEADYRAASRNSRVGGAS